MSLVIPIGNKSRKDEQECPAKSLDGQNRKSLAVEALAGGSNISLLARSHRVSRKFVYQQAEKAEKSLDKAFHPQEDPKVLFYIPVTRQWLCQLVMALVLICHASYRGVVEFLRDTLDVQISIGTVHNIIFEKMADVRRIHGEEDLSAIKHGAHDEIFQASKPVLAGCDVRSLYTYLLSLEKSRDGDTWGIHLLDLVDKGFDPDSVTADFGSGLRAGQREAIPDVPCRGDVFHAEREMVHLANYFENRAVGAISAREKLERKMAKARKRAKGNSFSKKLARARINESMAINLADDVVLLEQWMREEILAAAGPCLETRRKLYDFVVEELRKREALCSYRIRPVRTKLENQRDNLLAFVGEQEQRIKTTAEQFQVDPSAVQELFELQGRPDTDAEKWCRENQLRKELGSRFHGILGSVNCIIDETIRASSVVENLNSRLRNYFFLRNNLGPEYLELLRFFFNHRRFTASEHPDRKGKSPAELLTGIEHPHWLEMLGFERFKRIDYKKAS